jgi:hypothetical protein
MGFPVNSPCGKSGQSPFIPITGFISKGRNHPLEQISLDQCHHGKVLFMAPYAGNPAPVASPSAALLTGLTPQPYEKRNPENKKTACPVSLSSGPDHPLFLA